MSAALARQVETWLATDVVIDRSNGVRAQVSRHAIRRYVERGPFDLGEKAMLGLTDAQAMKRMRKDGWPVDEVEAKLAYFGGCYLQHPTAVGFIVDGVNLVMDGTTVVTCKRKYGRR